MLGYYELNMALRNLPVPEQYSQKVPTFGCYLYETLAQRSCCLRLIHREMGHLYSETTLRAIHAEIVRLRGFMAHVDREAYEVRTSFGILVHWDETFRRTHSATLPFYENFHNAISDYRADFGNYGWGVEEK